METINNDHEVIWQRQRERTLMEFQELCAEAMELLPREQLLKDGMRLAIKGLTGLGNREAMSDPFQRLSKVSEACAAACREQSPGKAQMFNIYAAVFSAAAEAESEGGAR